MTRMRVRREAVVEHLVTFRSAEGRDGSHTAPSLDEALRFVERLRNNEGASDVRVFRMQEVPIEFRTYFKVEVGEAKPDATTPGDDAPGAAELGEDDRPLVATANGDGDAPESTRRIFSRG
jgi:hypothetical protein